MKMRLSLACGFLVLSFNYAAFTAAAIIDSGPHHRVWQTVTLSIDDNGKEVAVTNSFTELATGLSYINPKTGKWAESQESFEIARTGEAIAAKGQMQVILAPNINSGGSVDLLTPDEKRFVSNPMGVSYYDSATGKTVLIAEVKDCVGQQVAPNIILYDDAFTELKGAIRYTYTRLGFSQDIILYQKPPSPADWGLDPATCTLDFYSEFHTAPVPEKSVQLIAPNLADETLDFGQSRIGQGSAYFLSQELDSVQVAKQWTTLEGRTFLIESVHYDSVLPLLEKLQAAVRKKDEGEFAKKLLPNRKELLAHVETKKSRRNGEVAAIQPGRLDPRSAFVLDYTTLNTSQTNYVFRPDSTYYCSGSVSLYGTNTVFIGGTVLKYNTGATLTVNTPVTCQGGLYRPVIMTAKDDQTVGANVGGGALSGYYATTALFIDASASSTNVTLQNLRVAYAQTAVAIKSRSGHVFSHVQLLNCQNGLSATNAEFSLRNALCYNVLTNFTGSSSTGRVEHLTSDTAIWLNKDIGTNLFLTNCLLVAVTNTGSYTGVSVSTNSDPSTVFTSAGFAYHYLADNTYRNLGTTNINATLASSLKKLTTYPPIVLVNAITVNTTLAPQAGRDNDTPDLGYHYDPLDYFACGVTVASNVTVLATNGVAVGIDYSTNSWGFLLKNAKFISTGDPLHYNFVVRAHMAQEKAGGNPGARACFYDGNSSSSSRDCELRLRFTEFDQLWDDGYMLYPGTKFGALEWTHCRVYDTSLVVDTTGSGTLVCGLTNTLWEWGGVQGGLSGTSSGSGVTVHQRNNLASNLSWVFYGGTTNWTVRDNLFDTLTGFSDNASPVENSYNGYINTAATNLSGGSFNKTNLVADYQTGLLGNYYYPTNGGSGSLTNLINAGSRNSTNAGLYHFTVRVDQSKETNTVVDIGYHYAAVDANRIPLDYDGDELADYFEDRDGNGIADTGETNWRVSENGTTGVPGLEVFTPLE